MSDRAAVTELLLSTGDRVEVDGALDEIERLLIAAARGAMMDLAHLVEASSGATIAVNPAHIVALREVR